MEYALQLFYIMNEHLDQHETFPILTNWSQKKAKKQALHFN